MTAEGFERKMEPVDSWEGAAQGLHMIVESALADGERPFKAGLLADAAGYLDHIRETDYQAEGLEGLAQADVHQSLALYGLRTNNFAVLDNSLGYLPAYSRYDVLYQTAIAKRETGWDGLVATEQDWQRWMSDANQVEAHEAAAHESGDADTYFNALAGQIAVFAERLAGDIDAGETRALALDVRNGFRGARDLLIARTHGRLRNGRNRAWATTELANRFDRLCGESGLWSMMLCFEGNDTPQRIYKAAAGALDADDQAYIAFSTANASSDTLDAMAIRAVGGDEAAKEDFLHTLEGWPTPLFSRNRPALAAYRWAVRELWAASIGLPEVTINEPEHLESYLEVARAYGYSSFGHKIRQSYAELALHVAQEESTAPSAAFGLALNMLRGDFMEPGPDDVALLEAYVERGHSIRVQVPLPGEQAETNRDALAKVEEAVTAWIREASPHVDERAEFSILLDLFDDVVSKNTLASDLIWQLQAAVEQRWKQLQRQKSQLSTVEALRDRVATLFEQAGYRGREKGGQTTVTVGENPKTGQRYL